MELTEIPVFFSPSTVLLVDDNHRFMRHISLQLAAPLHTKLFDDAEEALAYLSQLRNPVKVPTMVSDIESSTFVGHRYSMNCDLSAIHKIAYNQDRFKMVSVAMIDYAMPKMNGLSFCRRLKDSPIKKIMLTGEADHQVAIEAFNEGLIDQFILKSTPNLNQQLNEGILAMQREYFLDLSQNISYALMNEPSYCLKDPKVVEIFRALCKQYNIVEYYLLDSSGTVLLFDMFGHPSWFVVKSHRELAIYADFAQEDGLPEHLCRTLKVGQQIPFFPNMEIESSQWRSYLHPALAIEGEKESYYYALLNEHDIGKSNAHLEKSLSYINHLQKQTLSAPLMA